MKISNIEITSFRGIPHTLSLNTTKKGLPISFIIHGDNGTGKSSIVDAIEFCLQGRIERNINLNNTLRPAIQSLYYQKHNPGIVTITFDDNSKITRKTKVDEGDSNHIKSSFNLPHVSYACVPLVLRRNDIIQFNSIPIKSRQSLFLDFFYKREINKQSNKELLTTVQNSEYISTEDHEYINIQNNLQSYKNERRDLYEKLGTLIGSPIGASNNQRLTKINNFVSNLKNFKAKSKQLIEIDKSHSNLLIKNAQQIKKIITGILNINQKIKSINKDLKNRTNLLNKPNLFTSIGIFLEEASVFLFDGFRKISSVDYISKIDLLVSKQSAASLDILVHLNNGRKVSPNRIFSEANYDLMVLLLYVSLIRAATNRGQEKVLVLDDVLQSIDSTIRHKFMSYMLSEFNDWQFVITTHDRLWLNQLQSLFTSTGTPYKRFDITRWSFETGPILSEHNEFSSDETLKRAIASNDPLIETSIAGITLEKICHKLSVSLEISIHRTCDDKYTIGDLWPGISKCLRKSSVANIVEEIDKLWRLRNLAGCHYNEWAQSLSDTEIHEFSSAVLKLYEFSFCNKCCSWISIDGRNDIVAKCRCYNIVINKKNLNLSNNT